MKAIREQYMLVTGSTDGIGKITAQKLARMGAAVLLHGRNPEKCRMVRDEIWEASGNPKLGWVVADFSSFADVRHMVASIRETHSHLDVLINNAGVRPKDVSSGQRHLSAQGYEFYMAINYLAPFLLTNLLLPLLSAAGAARIVNVCSTVQSAIDFKDFMLVDNFSPMRAYAQSKLALTMFAFELSQRLQAQNITVNSLDPGVPPPANGVQPLDRSPASLESSAETEVFLATALELEGVSGAYFDRTLRSQAHPQACDPQAREQLWQLSLKLTDLAAGLQIP